MAKKRDIIIGLIIGGAFIVFTAMMALVLYGVSDSNGLEFGGFGQKIAIVEVEGAIRSSEDVVRQLRQFSDDDNVPAIVLRIDSPGGGVSASQDIYNEVLRARDKGKVVVASMGSMAASGGLYVAAAADYIMANPGTLTGSIGVIMQFPTAEKLLAKIGVRYETVKSGEFKDIGNLSRDMTEKEAASLQAVIDDTYEQFVESVAAGRDLDPDSVRLFADGRIFTGRQAVALKIVDELGDLQDALNRAAEMVNLETPPKTVRSIKRRRAGFLDLLGRSALAWLLDVAEEQAGSGPGLEYRFQN